MGRLYEVALSPFANNTESLISQIHNDELNEISHILVNDSAHSNIDI